MAGTSVELASAYVSLVPSLRGAEKTIGKELSSPSVQKATSKSGRSLGGALMGGLKTAGKVAAVGVGALLATSLGMGFKRLKGIENARASLGGLGHDAKDVDAIMTNALDAVKGTAFGMDDAAKVAASSVAAGIKPGKALESNLRLVADAATIGGSSLGEMGAIFNKVATSNKVQGDTINQLNQRGIPIIQLLGKQLGKSGEEVTALSKKGKIDFATFQKAMEAGMGGASLKSADTFSGALANTGAALSRFGATILSGIFPSMKTGLGGIIEIIDKGTTAIEPFAKAVGEWLGKRLEGAVNWMLNADFSGFGKFFTNVITKPAVFLWQEAAGGIRAFAASWKYNDGEVTSSGFPGFMERAAYGIHAVWDAIKLLDFSSVQNFFSSIGPAIGTIGPKFKDMGGSLTTLAPAFAKFGEILPEVAGAAGKLAGAGLDVVVSVLGFLADHVDTLIKFMPAIVAGFVAWKVAMGGLRRGTMGLQAAQLAMTPVITLNNILRLTAIRLEGRNAAAVAASTGATTANTGAQSTSLLVRARNTGAMIAQKVATFGATVATKAATVAQKGLNLVLRMNPIGLIVTAIALLVAAIVVLYKKNETARRLIDGAWIGIKNAFKGTINFFTKRLIPDFKTGAKQIGGFFKSLGRLITKTVDFWIVKPFRAVKKFIMVTLPNAFTLGKKLASLAFTILGNSVKHTTDKYIVKPFRAIQRFITKTIPSGFTTGKNLVVKAWRALGAGLKSIFDKTIRKPFDAIKNLITKTVPDGFKKGVGIIERNWKKVANVARKPINFVINDVYNSGLRKAFNSIASNLKLPKKWRLPHASEVPAFRKGGYTGHGGVNEPAGDVHRGEFVTQAKSTRKLQRTHPGLLNHINLYGEVPGYRKGGLVNPMPPQYRGISAGLNGYPGHAGTDYPAPVGTVVRSPGKGTIARTGWNLPGGTGKQVWINHINGLMSRVHHLSRILVSKGQHVNQGTPVGKVGMTGNTTGPHAHWGVMDGRRYLNPASVWGSGRGGGGNFYNAAGGGAAGPADGGRSSMLDKFLSPIKALKDNMFKGLKSKFGDNMMVQMGIGAGKKGLGAVTSFIKNKGMDVLESLKDTAGSAWSSTKNFLGFGNTQDKVRHVAKQYGWNKGAQWKAIKSIVGHESGWDMHAANPHSSAKGLFQKMTGLHGDLEPTAEGQAEWGLKYMKSRYGDPVKAWSHWQRNKSYAAGGLVDPEDFTAGRLNSLLDPHRNRKQYMGYDEGGYLQPGFTPTFNGSDKPEPVFTGSQWSTLKQAKHTEMPEFPRHITVRIGEREFEAYMDERVDNGLEKTARAVKRRR